MMKEDPLEIADSSGLSDADWAEISKLRMTHERADTPALEKALRDLCKRDAIRYIRIMHAILPGQLTRTVRDDVAAQTMKVER
jgi:hypothetical protein